LSTLGTVLPFEGIIFEKQLVRGVKRWSVVTSTASTATSFGGMASWGLGNRHVAMDPYIEVTFPRVVAASTTGLARTMLRSKS
jgi:hypothetical protein